MSSLRRFARPATMPGDAISCNTGWPWGGARAPPVGPRSSRGGHGLLFGWANRRWTHPLRMAVTPRTQRIAAPNNSESYSRRHPNLHEAGPNGRRRRRPCPLDCGKERSSLLSPSLTSGHGTRNIPAWVMFMRTEGAPPSTWLLVVGQFPSSVARACGVSASRPPPPADVGRASRHGDGRPPCVLGASASLTRATYLPTPRRGTKVHCTFWVCSFLEHTCVGRSREDWTGTRGGGRCR